MELNLVLLIVPLVFACGSLSVQLHNRNIYEGGHLPEDDLTSYLQEEQLDQGTYVMQ